MISIELNQHIRQATQGNKASLQLVVSEVQNDVYALALRMLVNPEDAQDATQEILIRLITKLSRFEFKSQFKTWVYRVAANYLLTEKKVLARQPQIGFDDYQADLESDLQQPGDGLIQRPEYNAMINELRISCTMAMLLCLNPAHRLAYILGDIYELEQQQAAEILGIEKANFRQQLSRARQKVIEFMNTSCGLVHSAAKCSCPNKLTGAVSRGRINASEMFFSVQTSDTYQQIKQTIAETQQHLKATRLQQAVPAYRSPEVFGQVIEELVKQGMRHYAS